MREALEKPAVVSDPSELKKVLERERASGKKIGFVPTMGYLHWGHLELMKIAKELSDFVVISIFVNPTQFGEGEDYSRYPRDLEGDLRKAAQVGVDLVFAPTVEAIYPQNAQTFVEVTELTRELCGRYRPGHFRGVTTVVAKLFNLVRPDCAVFGQKDYQQLVVIKQMVRDLFMDIEIIGAPIVRESDGLAMSSRNSYLSPEQRKAALALSKALLKAREVFAAGETDPPKIIEAASNELQAEPAVRVQYLELRDPETLNELERPARGTDRIFIAAFVGNTRLIDNAPLSGDWGIIHKE